MVSVSGHRLRVLVFMDYSNFRPSMEGTEAGFQIDLRPLGQCLANAALATVDPTAGLDFQRYAYVRVVRPVQQSREVSTGLVQ